MCQGDPLAMAIYAVAIMPMIQHLSRVCPTTTQCWYADDDGASDNLSVLRRFWDELNKVGPGFGYFPNAVKTILLTKSAHEDKAFELFSNTGVKIRTDGCHYLGGALGEDAFCRSYMEALVEKWRAELNELARIAETQPHAANTVFTKGLSSRWMYHIRSTNCPPDTFAVLDNLINTELLQALTGHAFQEDLSMRHLLAFPARMGGLAIPVLSKVAQEEHNASRRITASFVNIIAPGIRAMECGPILEAVAETRDQKRQERLRKNGALKEAVTSLQRELSPRQQLMVTIAEEKGVSSWLTAHPSRQYGTILNKSDFRDAVCLRFDLPLDGLPTSCVCGAAMTIDHALTCPCGGYPIARHNEVRDVIADVMREVVSDVEVELQLLPYADEHLEGRTTNCFPEVHGDIRARGFWTRQQDAFFDIRVTHPKDSLLSGSDVLRQLGRNEREKKTPILRENKHCGPWCFHAPCVFNQ